MSAGINKYPKSVLVPGFGVTSGFPFCVIIVVGVSQVVMRGTLQEVVAGSRDQLWYSAN